jgi:GDP-L-fucose synthase
MKKADTIVITGGSGQLGTSLKEFLPNGIYISSNDYDLTTESDVVKMYDTLKPDIVIHLAATVGGIMDNINRPYEYFCNNILMNTLMIDNARKRNISRFIGILSTCIYPNEVDVYPMTEDMLHNGPPAPTNFGYGYAKRCMEIQIESSNKQYGTSYQYITPCNLYGAHDKYNERSHFIAALIKKIYEARESKSNTLTLFGTGAPLRQFMSANDLANIINKCITDGITSSFNIAPDENLSIDSIARIALKALDCEYMKIEYDNTKPDGQFRKDVATTKFKTLFPQYKFIELSTGIKEAYEANFISK